MNDEPGGTVTCPNGHQNAAGQRFCGVCGAPLSASEPPPPPPSSSPFAGEQFEAEAAPTYPQERRPSRFRLWIGIGAAALVVILALVLVLPRLHQPPPENIRGFAAAPECGGGYEVENANVELSNQSNEIVGGATTSSDLLMGASKDLCLASFTINDVPDADFYKVKVGTHDGPIFQRDQLESNGWVMDLTLGGAAIPVAENVCDDADQLNGVLLDTDTLNKSGLRRRNKLDAATASLADDAAYLATQGDTDKAATIAQAVAPLVDLNVFGLNAQTLNDAVDSANTSMPALMLDCSQSWQNLSYS